MGDKRNWGKCIYCENDIIQDISPEGNKTGNMLHFDCSMKYHDNYPKELTDSEKQKIYKEILKDPEILEFWKQGAEELAEKWSKEKQDA